MIPRREKNVFKNVFKGLVPNRRRVDPTAAQFWFCPFLKKKKKYRNKSDKNIFFFTTENYFKRFSVNIGSTESLDRKYLKVLQTFFRPEGSFLWL